MSDNKKSAWNDCVSWDYRPKTAPEGLRILADWFDAVYDEAGTNAAVQNDLRDWAKNYTALESRVRELEAERDRLKAEVKEANMVVDHMRKEGNKLRARHAALVKVGMGIDKYLDRRPDLKHSFSILSIQLKAALAEVKK